MSKIETCHVVDQFCTSPANLEVLLPARGVCVHCGQAVCVKCSSRRRYDLYWLRKHGRVRVCNDCQIELDGNDKRVMARLRRLAGYK